MDNNSSITSMWKDLQTKDKLPKGELMSSCESELQELMKQIDIMVSSQKTDWERQIKSTQNRLDNKEKECIAQKDTIQQKLEQIEQLKKKIEDMEQSRSSVVDKYESQVTSLRSEVQKVKRDYEKLNKRHVKHTRESERLKEKLSDSTRGLVDTKRNQRVQEEYRQKNKDLELQVKMLERKLETVESQNRSLSEKCDFAEKHQQTVQSQLDKRRHLQESTEDSLKNQVIQMEMKLKMANENITSQDNKIFKLKRNLEEALNSHKKAMDDNEKILEEFKRLKNKLQQSELKSTQQIADLKAKDDLLRMVQEDAQQNTRDISHLEQTLLDKDNIIQSLSDMKRLEESEQVRMLKNTLSTVESELKAERKQHKKLNEDLHKTKSKFQTLQTEKQRLIETLQDKESELDRIENVEMNKLKSDLEKLQGRLYAEHESHQAELDSVKSELASVMTDLHESKANFGKLSEKVLVSNKQRREDSENLESKTAELQVCYAQIDALRIENRRIRQTILQQAEKNAQENLAEEHIDSLQTAYTDAISKLEKENRQLREDLHNIKNGSDDRSILFDVSPEDFQDERTIRRVTEEADRRIENLRNIQRPPESHYEKNRQLTYNDISEKHLPTDNTDARRKQDVFNSSCDTVLSSKAMSIVNSTRDLSFMDDLEVQDSGVSAAERFFHEEEQRAQELEKLLDTHIEHFKVGADALIEKFGQNA